MNTRLDRRRWRTRLIILGVIVSLLMLIGVTVLTHLSYQSAEVNLLIDHDRQVTFLSASRLETELNKFTQVLARLARTNEILSGDPALQQQALREESYALADFDGGVILLDNYGKVITSEPVRTGIAGQDWSDRDYFRDLLRTSATVYSNSNTDGADQEQVVVVCVPILNDEGHFIGALAGMFRLGQKTVSPFYASIVRLRLGQTGKTYVVDDNGIILFDSSGNLVGTNYDTHAPGIPLGETSGAKRIIDSNQEDMIVSYAQIPGTSWSLVTEEQWNILTGNLQRYVNLLLGLMILAIIIPSAGLGLLLFLRSRELASFSFADHEMRIAREMKQKLVPERLPVLPGWMISVYHRDGREASSEYFDYQNLQDGRLMLAAARINEPGMPGMFDITLLRSSLHGAAQRLLTPGEALDASNGILCQDLEPHTTMDCLYAVFDPARKTIDYAIAGENLTFVINGSNTHELLSTGSPIGFDLGTHYAQYQETLQPDGRLVFCSDEILHVKNKNGEEFGKPRLVEILCGPLNSDIPIIERLETELKAFSGSKFTPETDISILVLEPAPEW